VYARHIKEGPPFHYCRNQDGTQAQEISLFSQMHRKLHEMDFIGNFSALILSFVFGAEAKNICRFQFLKTKSS
jgi:hypothetical protein